MDMSLLAFQQIVNDTQIRNKSIIDVMTKLTESSSRINRAVAKSVTVCGCIELTAQKQSIPFETSLEDAGKIMKSHVDGDVCDHCLEVLQDEIGNHLFYIASLCNALDIDLNDALQKELDKVNTLGRYNML
ncbi:MAG: DUF1573 domain-containing protein [Clostridium sp.]|uniref:DUF1573 domain-containing protein n=1 Tax=Clostridium sp. TaxID=1506 RepID=UPI002FCA752C